MIRFVLLAGARTGSSYLVSALNANPEVLCHGEVFHRNTFKLGHGLSTEMPGLDRATRDSDTAGFTDRLYRTSFALHPDKVAVGLKLFPEHGADRMAYFLGQRGIRRILLTRENKLAAWSSLLIARRTQVWNTRSNAELPPRSTVAFDPDAFGKYLRTKLADERLIRDACGNDLFSIEYKEVTSPEVLRALVGFLGCTPAATADGAFVKMNTSDILDRFSNPEAAARYLREHGLERWANE